MNKKYIFYILALILVASFIIRLNFVEEMPNNQDDIFYHKAAEDLSNFSKPAIYVNGKAFPTMVFLGYPFILSIFYMIFGSSYFLGEIVTIIFSILSLILFFLIAKKLFNAKAGLIACILLAFSPLHLILSTRILTDIPSLALMLLAIYVYFFYEGRYKYHLFGILMGVNYFIRTSSIILVFIPFFDNLFSKRKFYKNYHKVLLSFLPFILLFFLLNFVQYGDPFTIGYGYYEEKLNFVFFYDMTSPFPRFVGETLQEKLGGVLFFIYSFIHGGNIMDSFGATFATFSQGILIFVLIFLFRMKDNDEHLKSYKKILLILALSNILFYSLQRYYGVRYMIVTYSIFILIAGGELENLSRKLINSPKIRALSVISVLILILIPSFISAMPYLSFFHNNQLPIVHTLRWMDKNTENDSIIITDYFIQANYYSSRRVIPIRILDEASIRRLMSSNSDIYFIEDFFTRMQPTKCFAENMVPNNISATRERTKDCRVYNIINRYPASKMVLDYVLENYNSTRLESPFGIVYHKINNN